MKNGHPTRSDKQSVSRAINPNNSFQSHVTDSFSYELTSAFLNKASKNLDESSNTFSEIAIDLH